MDFFFLLLIILATYRTTHFIISDELTERIREFVWRRFPPENYLYDDRFVRPSDDGLSGWSISWPFKRRLFNTDGMWWSDKQSKLGYLLLCFFCVSVYVSFGLTFAFAFLATEAGIGWITILSWLAAAGGAELVNNQLGR